MNQESLVRRRHVAALTTCQGGYYNRGNGCHPVGPGFYSPDNDAARYPCTPGTIAASGTAIQCTVCPAGTFAAQARATACIACARGSYALNPAAAACVACNDLYYTGLASDYAIYLSGAQTGQAAGDLYCLEPLEGPVFAQPTQSPSTTETPTARPTVSPHFTQAPSRLDSDDAPPTVVTQAPTAGTVPSLTMAPTSVPSSSFNDATWTPTTLVSSSSLLSSTASPTAPLHADALQDVLFNNNDLGLSNDPDDSLVTTTVSNLWLPIFLALVVATALGLVVLWASFEAQGHDDESDDDESCFSRPSFESGNDDEVWTMEHVRPRSNSGDSVSTWFVDEMETGGMQEVSLDEQPSNPRRDLKSGGSSVWSLSAGLGHYEFDSEVTFEDERLSI